MQTLKHGTYQQGYKLGCREQCCMRAYSRWSSNQYNQRRRAGHRVVWVSPEEVVERVQLLRDKYRYTTRQIGRAANVSDWSICSWINGSCTRLKDTTAKRIMDLPLKVQIKDKKPWSLVPSTGARRRLQAMMYRGFTGAWIYDHCGVDPKTLKRIRTGETETIQKKTHDAIVSALNETLLTEDPEGYQADRTREEALRNGYLPYGIWDDIDDPDCVPDNLYAEHQDPVLQDAVDRVKDQVSRGFMIIEIADVAGVPRGNLNKIIHGKKKQVLPETAKKIHAACDEFETRDEPTGSNADRARRIAKRNGWR